MHKTAILSDCGIYRYKLTRHWPRGFFGSRQPRSIVFIGLNPSTADDKEDDNTIRRCIDFAKRWDYDGLIMLNLFAFRNRDPKVLCNHPMYVGPDNDRHILETVEENPHIVACWGGDKVITQSNRDKQVVELINRPMLCLGYTKFCHPLHPLFVPASTELVEYKVRK